MNALDWLLDSDPAIRWQAMRDLAQEPADVVDALRRRLSSGALIEPEFSQSAYPTGWHYDVLRGLDYLRDAGATPDNRMDDAIELVRSKRDDDGRWLLERQHESEMVNSRIRDLGFDMGEAEGTPSRWNTLRAMRVLAWFEAGR